MEKTVLSRQQLESASTADLLALADDYGIDIPDNLNRRILIGELLEIAQEQDSYKPENDVLINNEEVEMPEMLPRSYNETQICMLLRTPAWAFVFWDIREAELETLTEDDAFKNFFLHVAFFDTATADMPSDSFDIQISPSDREQYVFLPAGKKYVIINLKCAMEDQNPKVLAYTKRIEIPQESKAVTEMQPGKKVDMNPLIRLSGMEELARAHFMAHRQSFS
ncbi:MAG TPA: hypothetical protein DEO40_03465 [Treponema sp.]|nr:hypothetical protein [Treponema sp.]HCA19717.1 hypothetical protein [Treponema sp.]